MGLYYIENRDSFKTLGKIMSLKHLNRWLKESK